MSTDTTRLEERVAKLEGSVEQMDKRIGDMNDRMNERFDTLEGRIDRLDEKVDRELNNLRTDIRRWLIVLFAGLTAVVAVIQILL